MIYATVSFFMILFLNVSCKDNTPKIENPNEYVNNWIYKTMTTYYYWNEKIPV